MQTVFVGNLAKDPIFTITSGGIPSAQLRIACSESYRDAKGEWRSKDPVFWPCYAWADAAEAIREQGWVKGEAVIIVGEIIQRTWQDEHHQSHSVKEVTIRHAGPNVTRRKKRNNPSSGAAGEFPAPLPPVDDMPPEPAPVPDAEAEVGI